MTRYPLLALMISFSACRDQQPAAPTPEQADQLNNAEDMLNRLAENEEGPEHGPGPSNSSD
jgi:hypothetical protein